MTHTVKCDAGYHQPCSRHFGCAGVRCTHRLWRPLYALHKMAPLVGLHRARVFVRALVDPTEERRATKRLSQVAPTSCTSTFARTGATMCRGPARSAAAAAGDVLVEGPERKSSRACRMLPKPSGVPGSIRTWILSINVYLGLKTSAALRPAFLVRVFDVPTHPLCAAIAPVAPFRGAPWTEFHPARTTRSPGRAWADKVHNLINSRSIQV